MWQQLGYFYAMVVDEVELESFEHVDKNEFILLCIRRFAISVQCVCCSHRVIACCFWGGGKKRTTKSDEFF